jgi:ABC-2 type transport system ATP-binding protein
MSTTDRQYAVQTFSLTKVFTDWWGRSKVVAVDNLNLQVRYNEVFGLLGPNGSGKTTTLKLLLALLHPTKGKSLVLGGDSSDPKISARIGFLPEESYLYKYLTARETLDFYGKLFGLPGRIREHRIDTLLEMVGLQAVAHRPVGTFSKGMARRIGLAQALINDPELLILDEPTSGLDPIGTRQIKDLIIHLARRGKTILLCSHLLADVEDVCDRIAILYGGRMQTQGRVDELLQRTDRTQILTGKLTDAAINRVKNVLESENMSCDVTCPMDKLESFFINIVQQAQQRGEPTSGPLSTTQIADFLVAQKSSAEQMLDELVRGPVTAACEAVATEPVEPPQPGPNRQLLQQLTDAGRSVVTDPVSPQPAQTEPPETSTQLTPDQANKNILEQLTERQPQDRNRPDEQAEGDRQNA